MRNVLRFTAVLVLAVALAAGASRLPRLLDDVDAFRIRDVRLEGARFLTREEALRWAAVPTGASVWDDTAPWEAGLRSHPLVRDATIDGVLFDRLVVRVEEREPVALLPTPTLEPVDATGRPLPLDPVRRSLDLPVIRPVRGPDGRPLTPEQLRVVAREIGRLEELDPRFLASVSEVALGDRSHVVLSLADPPVEVLFRPPLGSRRLREGLEALSDALSRTGGRALRQIDLRYDDQVIVRLDTTTTARQSD